MRIALISYEFAGTRGGGGIGTYVRNAAQMLCEGGHTVHVFTAEPDEDFLSRLPGLEMTAVKAAREDFASAVVEPFRIAQQAAAFDVVEGPEYGCDAAGVAQEFPELPLVVHLHGPTFTLGASNAKYIGRLRRWRFALGALVRGRMPYDPWRYDPMLDSERTHVLAADEVIANSQATADRCLTAWELDRERLTVLPYPFLPPANFVTLPPSSASGIVLFLGKLEVRKGVLELARAIPKVLVRHPNARFRFVGRVLPHPDDGRPVSDHIRELAGSSAAGSIEIVGSVPYDEIVCEFAQAQVCTFPSDWEASGFVCFEGMAAGRAVVGSSSGGMAESIEDGRSGRLVPPNDPSALAIVLSELLDSPDICRALGARGRDVIADRYAPANILPLQIQSYARAIKNAGARHRSHRYGPVV